MKLSVERGGDDASGHKVSLVMAVTEKATDNHDYNYSFQQMVDDLENEVRMFHSLCRFD